MINFRKVTGAMFSGSIKGHFGQWAEDVLVRKLFDKNKMNGIYLDIGSYHPFTHSNTAYLWMKGWTGFNVDANPNTIEIFRKIRPKDTNIWSAIVPSSDYENGLREISLMLPEKTDYKNGIVAAGTVNNEVGSQRGFSASKKVPAQCISKLIADFNISNIDYLNIDIEGYDEAILCEIDFKIIKPTVFSIEDYSDTFLKLTSSNITRQMELNDYSLAGRAGPTSIFLKNH